METETLAPRLPRQVNTRRITIWFDEETEEIYRIGKANGWDTPEIARQAVVKAIRDMAVILKKTAKSA